MRIIGFSNAAASPFWITPVQALAPWLCRIRNSLGHVTDLPAMQRQLLEEIKPRRHQPDMASAVMPKNAASNDPHFTVYPKTDRLHTATSCPAPHALALRVVRESDNGLKADCAGRMVISGKIADICAELDRMEQRAARAGG